MNQERTPPTKEALASALTLSEEILKNIEHSEIPLTNIALKTSRLARLLNEPMYQKMMEYEAGGYPATPDKAPRQEIWDTAIRAGRRYTKKDKTSGEVKEFVYRESIAELEDELRIGESSLAAAHDPDISIASSNPHQFVSPPIAETLIEAGVDLQLCPAKIPPAQILHNYGGYLHKNQIYGGLVAQQDNAQIRHRIPARI